METGKALVIAGLLFLGSASLGFVAMMDLSSDSNENEEVSLVEDPLIQGEGHDLLNELCEIDDDDCESCKI